MWAAGADIDDGPEQRRARRISLERDFIGGENTFDSVGNVSARQGRAADIFYILVQFQWRRGVLADKLVAPIGIAHFVAITFPVGHNLNLLNGAVGIQADGVGDIFVFTDDFIDDKKTAVSALP